MRAEARTSAQDVARLRFGDQPARIVSEQPTRRDLLRGDGFDAGNEARVIAVARLERPARVAGGAPFRFGAREGDEPAEEAASAPAREPGSGLVLASISAERHQQLHRGRAGRLVTVLVDPRNERRDRLADRGRLAIEHARQVAIVEASSEIVIEERIELAVRARRVRDRRRRWSDSGWAGVAVDRCRGGRPIS